MGELSKFVKWSTRSVVLRKHQPVGIECSDRNCARARRTKSRGFAVIRRWSKEINTSGTSQQTTNIETWWMSWWLRTVLVRLLLNHELRCEWPAWSGRWLLGALKEVEVAVSRLKAASSKSWSQQEQQARAAQADALNAQSRVSNRAKILRSCNLSPWLIESSEQVGEIAGHQQSYAS